MFQRRSNSQPGQGREEHYNESKIKEVKDATGPSAGRS
ncbi:hypothetical protein glysoja_023070 [Glycine soja]|nr:hypothetical protein glysoja_023070 [Glycine soja]